MRIKTKLITLTVSTAILTLGLGSVMLIWNANKSSQAMLQLGRTSRAIRDLDGFLKAIKFERSAIIGVNYFAVSVGGIDAIRDLEEDRGVDPETLAGLRAGFAVPEVAEHLNLLKTPDGSGVSD